MLVPVWECPFSPLFIGVIGATGGYQQFGANLHRAFSPLFIGVIGATDV